MSHGIAGFESGNVIWEWCDRSEEGLALFANSDLVQGDDPSSKVAQRTLINVMGPVSDGLSDDEYSRFQPWTVHDLSLMYQRCYQYSGGSRAIVTSAHNLDFDVKRVFETFLKITGELEERDIERRPLKNLLRPNPIGLPWAYLINFCCESNVFFFLSDDENIVSAFEKHCRTFSDEIVSERW